MHRNIFARCVVAGCGLLLFEDRQVRKGKLDHAVDKTAA